MPFGKIDVLVNLKIQALTFYKLDGSRIRDMEAESHNWSHFLLNL